MKNILYIAAPGQFETSRTPKINVVPTTLDKLADVKDPSLILFDQSLLSDKPESELDNLLDSIRGLAVPGYLLVDRISKHDMSRLSVDPALFRGVITPRTIKLCPELLSKDSLQIKSIKGQLKTDLLVPWAMAAVEILQASEGSQALFMGIVHGPPEPSHESVAASVPLSGEFKGQCVMVSSRTQARRLAAQLACCSEEDVSAEDLIEGIMEIINQISSQARTNCWDHGPQFEIECPVEYNPGGSSDGQEAWVTIILELFDQPCSISIAGEVIKSVPALA